MMDGGFVDRILMSLERLSMQSGAVHDRNSVLKDPGRDLDDDVRWYAKERCIDISYLPDVGGHRNGSEQLRELPSCTCYPTYKSRQTEIVAQGNEFRTDLSHPPKADDHDSQWFQG